MNTQIYMHVLNYYKWNVNNIIMNIYIYKYKVIIIKS